MSAGRGGRAMAVWLLTLCDCTKHCGVAGMPECDTHHIHTTMSSMCSLYRLQSGHCRRRQQ